MDVGVRELKRRLSDYLERAARGEIIQVTDRGRPKAILAPLPHGPRLEQGIAEGWIRSGSTVRPRPARRHPSARRVLDLLAEDRGA
jgi:prevent-host-death family protein